MVPANFHPDISKNCDLWTCAKIQKRNSSTFEATPPSPGGPGPKIFFAYFFPWSGALTPSNFQIEVMQKNLGKIFPQGGLTPKIFGKVDVSPLG